MFIYRVPESVVCRLGELKSRRFVGKEAETNPFLEMVEKAVPEDVD